jgi:hypothetical protein
MLNIRQSHVLHGVKVIFGRGWAADPSYGQRNSPSAVEKQVQYKGTRACGQPRPAPGTPLAGVPPNRIPFSCAPTSYMALTEWQATLSRGNKNKVELEKERKQSTKWHRLWPSTDLLVDANSGFDQKNTQHSEAGKEQKPSENSQGNQARKTQNFQAMMHSLQDLLFSRCCLKAAREAKPFD